MRGKLKVKIFYSWQSDLSNKTNRSFIEDALEKAIKEIKSDNLLEIEPVLDRDTAGVSGAPDIVQTIFEKITDAQVFVCDVSIVNQGNNKRLTPNPNVLIELGYAFHVLGHERIILVMNTEYGKVEELPFDIRSRRIVTYSVSEDDQDKRNEKKSLIQKLKHAIAKIDFSDKKDDVRHYLIGDRLQNIRNELGLSSSQFVEQIGLLSEKNYLQMESNDEECSEEIINTIFEKYGIFPNFLKHGDLPIFEVEMVNWFRKPEECAKEIINRNPSGIYLTVNTTVPKHGVPIFRHIDDFFHEMTGKHLLTGLIIQVDENRYRFINLNISMKFFEDAFLTTKYASSYYTFLYTLADNINDSYYIQIPNYRIAKQLFAGNIYPSEIIRRYFRYHGYLPELVIRGNIFHKNVSWINGNRKVFEDMGLMQEY